jgi:DNA repair photolyase
MNAKTTLEYFVTDPVLRDIFHDEVYILEQLARNEMVSEHQFYEHGYTPGLLAPVVQNLRNKGLVKLELLGRDNPEERYLSLTKHGRIRLHLPLEMETDHRTANSYQAHLGDNQTVGGSGQAVKPGIRLHFAKLKSGISPTPEFAKKGLASYSINVGTKCGHDCTYCSTGAMLRMHFSFKEAGENPFEYGYEIIDPDTSERVARDARHRRERGLIQLCTTVDAWSPGAQKYTLGRRCLEAVMKESGWSVRILTKNEAVQRNYDLIQQYRDRILIGLSLTATPDKSHIMRVIEPNASSIPERMEAMEKAHQMGLRTYGMFCPLLPGIADSPEDIEQLIKFGFDCGAEEFFVEPVNARGPGLKNTEAALRRAGFLTEADAIAQIRCKSGWSAYVVQLLANVQESLKHHGALDRLRFLLYPSRLTPADEQWIRAHSEGVKWLGNEPPESDEHTSQWTIG